MENTPQMRFDHRFDIVRARAAEGAAAEVIVAQTADLLADPRGFAAPSRRQALRLLAGQSRMLDAGGAERLLRCAIRSGAAPRALRALRRFADLPIYQRFASIYAPEDKAEPAGPSGGRPDGSPSADEGTSGPAGSAASGPAIPEAGDIDEDVISVPDQLAEAPLVTGSVERSGSPTMEADEAPAPAAEAQPVSLDGPLAASASDVEKSLKTPAQPPAIDTPDLAQVGASDVPSAAEGASQLQLLIDRIDAYRSRHMPAEDRESGAGETGERRWTTDELLRLDDAGRQLFGVLSLKAAQGPDSDDLRSSMGKYLPFSDLRLLSASGVEIAVSATPNFARPGNFVGYSGSVANLDSQSSDTFGLSPETVSEITHEGRTPLNAILGYAQMIESEILGPASPAYREDASAILTDANKLLSALDALGDSAAIADGRVNEARAPCALRPLAKRLVEEHKSLAASRTVDLSLAEGSADPVVLTDEFVLRRSLARLLSAAIAVAGAGETITVAVLARDARYAQFAITGPGSIENMMRSANRGSGNAVDTEREAPVLGFDFTLRLARRFAESQGGRFVIDDGAMTITLPSAGEAALRA